MVSVITWFVCRVCGTPYGNLEEALEHEKGCGKHKGWSHKEDSK